MTINQILSNRALLSQLYVIMVNLSDFMKTGMRSQVLCPFHDDTEPSAKLYKDKDGERLYCYACQKQYTSYHYVKLVLEKDPRKWLEDKFGLVKLKEVIDSVDLSVPEDYQLDLTDDINAFKQHKDVVRFLANLYSFKEVKSG